MRKNKQAALITLALLIFLCLTLLIVLIYSSRLNAWWLAGPGLFILIFNSSGFFLSACCIKPKKLIYAGYDRGPPAL